MHAILDQYLTVVDPGSLRPALLQLATVTKRGRLQPGEARVIRYWRQTANTVVLPRGLWPRIAKQWPMRVIDRRVRFHPQSFRFQGTLFPYQRPAVAAILRQEGGTLVAMPGAGKTIMGLALAAAWSQPTLWLVNTLELKRVAEEKARALFDLPDSAYGFIGDGEYRMGSHFTIGMVQTLATDPAALAALGTRIGTVIVDESHHTPALSYTQILNYLPARFRAGLSATPDRTDGLGPLMVAILGPRVVIPQAVLLGQDRIVLPRVYRIRTAFETPAHHWATMEKARAWDVARNRLIVALVRQAALRHRHILVLVERRDHAVLLARMLRAAHIRAKALISDVPATERNRWWDLVADGKAVVIATRLANEGLDVQRLDCLILGAAGRSPVRLEQQIGRVMRTAPGKPNAEVWDLVDGRIPTYARQAAARRAFYDRQGYQVVDSATPMKEAL